jgi:uncharacterized SAM-binding protein YcdF (DUF218 family)
VGRTLREARLTGLLAGALLALFSIPIGVPTIFSGFGDCLWLVPIYALAGVLLGTLPWGRRLLLGATLAAALAWGIVVFTPVARGVAAGLVRRDPPSPADAVFVFSSRVQKGGGLTTVAEARLLHGLVLVREGLAPRLVLSEVAHTEASHAAAARALMEELGLHAELLSVGAVENTHDEAVALAALARERGFRRILAVTSPLHSLRASLCLEAQGLEAVSSPAPEINFDLDTLDRGGERIDAFRAALHERLGLLAYARRGWLGPSAR